MVPLFHGSVDGWFPAQSPLSHLQLIIPSPSFFLEAALLSCFASSLSSIALMHLVRLRVSKSQLSHFWIIEPSRFWAFFFFYFFFPATPLPSFLSSCFFFPVLSMMVGLYSHLFCVSSWLEREVHDTQEEVRSPHATQPGLYAPLEHAGKPQGFIHLPCTVISGYTWYSRFNRAKWKHIYITISPSAKPTVSPLCVRAEHKNKATTQQEWPT